jgi:cobalt-zinc-cadmium resistance protein CzcA
VQRPLALVVVGGMLFAPVLILLVLPVLIDKFSKRGTVLTDDSRDIAPDFP